ncbi:MAG: acyl carrier protein [Deltaproteobacteria bacterium]|nr:acyl carrier protein [Deltaproteobacteria bacterium]
MTRDEIFARIADLLVEMFELNRDDITLQSHLVNDLDLDSIDAIDMVVKLQEITGKRVPEDQLRKVRTIADVVDLVQAQLAQA